MWSEGADINNWNEKGCVEGGEEYLGFSDMQRA